MTASLRQQFRRLRPTRERPAEHVLLLVSILVLVLGTVWSIVDDNTEVKVAGVVIIVVVLSSLVLSMRAMVVQLAVVVGCILAVFEVHGFNPDQLSISGVVMVAVVGLVGVIQARRRDRLGLKQVSAETVIGLIRDRLLVQSQLPVVPDGWTVQVQQRPADGAAISGDFVANRLVCDGLRQELHLAVIDVSGSGITAGPRSLLLSGAMGGLLGAVEPDQFLAAANDYLARQQWSLGFASAIYVVIDLRSGEYSVRVAGHPPAMQFRPECAPPWRTSTASGTVLGVLPTLSGRTDRNVLQPGEALFLYTDGLVEDRTRDLDQGTARLQDTVERLTAGGDWADLAHHLVEQVPGKHDDDRTVVVIRRASVPTVAQLPAALTSAEQA